MARPIVRSLIIDELVTRKQDRFRVRVWCSKSKSPVAVFSQVGECSPPDAASAYLANMVVSGFLGFRMPLPSFYESSVVDGVNRVFRVSYTLIGNPLRPMLTKPSYGPLSAHQFQSCLLQSTGSSELL